MLLAIWLAMSLTTNAQVFPVDTILNNGLPGKRIKYVFLSDGYQAGELFFYINQVKNIQADFFTQTPFREYRNFFNFYAIKVPSLQSGADHPGTAGDEDPGSSQPIVTVNNYFNSTFDYAGIHRLVVPQDGVAAYNVLLSNFPTYNQAFVLVNSPYYGGSGGSFATATTDGSSSEVAIHEIGHSFAGLADEYAIGGQGEAPNRTADTNPATIKWKNWLGDNGIGIYPIGVEGWQRPHQSCKMQYLGVPFCSVCTEAFINTIYALVTPIYSSRPTSALVTVNAPTTFSATLTRPEPNTLVSEWKLNGATIAANTDSVIVTPDQLNTGNNTLTMYVTDQTGLSRTYLPNAGYVFSQSWDITSTLSPVQNVDKTDKFYYQMSPNPTSDVLTIRGNADYALQIAVEVYNETGARVYQQQIAIADAYEHRIDMTPLASGIYTVVLRLPNGFIVQEQIIKAK